MDIASQSIIRHEPYYDARISALLGCKKDTLLEAAYLQSYQDLPEIRQCANRPKGEIFQYPLLRDPRPTVSVEVLAKASRLVPLAHEALLKDADLLGSLAKRKVSIDSVKRFKLCKTETLYENLEYEDSVNLSIAIHQQFYTIIGAGCLIGVSVPYTYMNHFLGFATRVLDKKQSKFVKYAFTTPRKVCFGLDHASEDIFIVEGVFDAIAMDECGMGSIGLGDSQPSPWQLAVCLDKNINLCLDNDYAGCIGMLKAANFLAKLNKEFKIYLLDGKDPAEHLLKLGKSIDSSYIASLDDLRDRIKETFDPTPMPSWFDHKSTRHTVVDFSDTRTPPD